MMIIGGKDVRWCVALLIPITTLLCGCLSPIGGRAIQPCVLFVGPQVLAAGDSLGFRLMCGPQAETESRFAYRVKADDLRSDAPGVSIIACLHNHSEHPLLLSRWERHVPVPASWEHPGFCFWVGDSTGEVEYDLISIQSHNSSLASFVLSPKDSIVIDLTQDVSDYLRWTTNGRLGEYTMVIGFHNWMFRDTTPMTWIGAVESDTLHIEIAE